MGDAPNPISRHPMIFYAPSILSVGERASTLYETFVKRYSMAVISNAVFGDIMSGITDDADERAGLNRYASRLSRENSYVELQARYTGMMLSVSFPQAREKQGLFLDEVMARAEHGSGLAEQLVHIGNAREIVSYFVLFEDILKSVIEQLGGNRNARNSELIDELRKLVRGKEPAFLEALSSRSQIDDFSTIYLLWRYFSRVRNLLVHDGGYYGPEWREDYLKLKRSLSNRLLKADYIQFHSLADEFGADAELQNGFYSPSNLVVNLLHNFSKVVMESLYLSEII
ncbi:hypothetical protein [Burkholderia gladioli]|nr:hypothetical protein [Burkholderia gladioli]MDN7922829.1 hypothetical protein [Burkholderia gladioli]